MTWLARLGIAQPVLQAPMAGAQDSELAIAVARAGGLGAIPCAMLTPDALAQQLSAFRAATPAAINVNVFCHVSPAPDPAALARWHAALAPWYQAFALDSAAIPTGAGRHPFDHAACDVLEAFRPEVVSCHFGLPSPELVARIKGWGGLLLASATTVAEARWLEAHGADAVIAQGLEAGGHRGHFLSDDLTAQMGTLALLPQVCQAVEVPVIAAGGIADASGVSAALALGASAVQVGTAFLCCPESRASAIHRRALMSEAARHTALTNLFSGRPARGIVNRLMRELGPLSEAPPAFPLATAAIAPLRAAAEARGLGDASPLWAGQNASRCRALPAGEVVQELARGAGALTPLSRP